MVVEGVSSRFTRTDLTLQRRLIYGSHHSRALAGPDTRGGRGGKEEISVPTASASSHGTGARIKGGSIFGRCRVCEGRPFESRRHLEEMELGQITAQDAITVVRVVGVGRLG